MSSKEQQRDNDKIEEARGAFPHSPMRGEPKAKAKPKPKSESGATSSNMKSCTENYNDIDNNGGNINEVQHQSEQRSNEQPQHLEGTPNGQLTSSPVDGQISVQQQQSAVKEQQRQQTQLRCHLFSKGGHSPLSDPLHFGPLQSSCSPQTGHIGHSDVSQNEILVTNTSHQDDTLSPFTSSMLLNSSIRVKDIEEVEEGESPQGRSAAAAAAAEAAEISQKLDERREKNLGSNLHTRKEGAQQETLVVAGVLDEQICGSMKLVERVSVEEFHSQKMVNETKSSNKQEEDKQTKTSTTTKKLSQDHLLDEESDINEMVVERAPEAFEKSSEEFGQIIMSNEMMLCNESETVLESQLVEDEHLDSREDQDRDLTSGRNCADLANFFAHSKGK